MRVVFDTNVYISAAIKSELAENLIELAAKTDLITLLTSEEILDELREKLISKFERSETITDIFINRIRKIAELIEITEKVNVVKRDPSDNKILECALAGEADLIVSSDQDLIKLKNFQGIGIVHPKTLSWTFLEYLKKKNKN